MSSHPRALSHVLPPVLSTLTIGLILTSCRPSIPTPPMPPRDVAAASSEVYVAWTYENARSDGYPLAGGTDSMMYVYRVVQDGELVAIHSDTGLVAWVRPLLAKEKDIQSLAQWRQLVLAASNTELTAYSTTTGGTHWQTHLGDGHVPVILQVDADVLRVYYGDRLFEADPVDGSILRDTPIEDILWIQGTAVIHAPPSANEMWATNAGSGELLWQSNESPFLRKEWSIPAASGQGSLLVRLSDGSICELSISTGTYRWCRDDGYLSNVAVDAQGEVAYSLTEGFALQALDTQKGDLLQSIQFLPSALPESLRDHGFWYSVATSDEEVSVLFGDSWQIFGLTGLVP